MNERMNERIIDQPTECRVSKDSLLDYRAVGCVLREPGLEPFQESTYWPCVRLLTRAGCMPPASASAPAPCPRARPWPWMWLWLWSWSWQDQAAVGRTRARSRRGRSEVASGGQGGLACSSLRSCHCRRAQGGERHPWSGGINTTQQAHRTSHA
jgi:hypothetical protein